MRGKIQGTASDVMELTAKRMLECMEKGISPCCEAPVDESLVLPNGSGYRSYSKCGGTLWHLRARCKNEDEPEGQSG
jgi:hypothetical protein